MDKIFVEGMAFYGYHGAFPEENKLGQRFFADVIMEMDTRQAAQNDRLEDTVNYAKVYEYAKHVLEGEPVSLVETLANKLSDVLLRQFEEIEAVTVKVKKTDPPIPGHYDNVAVEIRRERSHL